MRLIDADALIYTKAFAPCGNGKYDAVNIVYETDIDAAPTIDPVKHGKWIKDDVGVHCSECFCGWDFLTGIPVEVYGFNYCPNCGAKMDGGEG